MSAQVTEKHIDLVRCVLDAEWWGSNVEKKFAQLIADSEAKATAQLRAEVDAQCLLNAKGSEREAVLLGRVDRMAKECLNLRADLDAIKAIRNEETARAERAEADARRERVTWEAVDQRASDLAKSLEEAEAELATERARLDWLELRGPWESWNGFGETGITLRENIRAAIDAAMKEETK